ncbi:dihydrofolate reductase family protein [Chitinophaga alhagiae]|uniref:dihydrofolate reductase family protein n=1 Tax=Chitinophaga alhagiae TaxID=2203219 RepID=UPI000E5B1BFF|nr:dihydrofolate reductase family protein [Chitinophaga alhagiae]
MRKIKVITFSSLDGVIQAPGGPGEDTSNNFKFGGWSVNYGDETIGQYLDKATGQPHDLLLGRKTYDIFAGYWPFKGGPMAEKINKATKYVATGTLQSATWDRTVLLNKNTLQQVKELKAQNGIDLLVWGSANFLQTLLAEQLVDELILMTYPLLLGKGKRLFDGNAAPGSLQLTDHAISGTGVIIAQYQPAGAVVTGEFDEEDATEQELEQRKK